MRSLHSLIDLLRRRLAAGTVAREEVLAGALAGVLLVVASTLLIARHIAHLPADHFTRQRSRPAHPVLALLALLARNTSGALLLVLGLILSLPGVPGPGLATMFIGFALLDFPGKRGLELRLLRRARVRTAIDRLRARHGQPPLELPPDEVPPAAPSPTGPAAPTAP